MSYFGYTVYGELKGKFRLDVKSHTDDLITCQVIKQTSIKIITIATHNNSVDVLLNLFI